MGGAITAAVAVGGVSMYTASKANKAADERASVANANNAAAAEQSRLLAEQSASSRQAELLRRFNITSGKVKDSVNDVYQATALNLTNLDMDILKANSVTDNALATKHIEGRLSQRLQSVIDIKGDMQKGSILQGTEQQVRSVNEKLSSMRMDLESEQMNVDIDLHNAINQANNQEIMNYTYSSSTGTLGVISSGISGAASGASLTSSYYNAQAAQARVGGTNG